jgi:hypothetical protein
MTPTGGILLIFDEVDVKMFSFNHIHSVKSILTKLKVTTSDEVDQLRHKSGDF